MDILVGYTPNCDHPSERALVCAIIVTFNRKTYLIDCLKSVLNQTRAVEIIKIIDNNSTDGTREYLAESGFLDDERVEYINLGENAGGAGGVRAGAAAALKTSAEWVWLMDDDIMLAPDCLEKLLANDDKPVLAASRTIVVE